MKNYYATIRTAAFLFILLFTISNLRAQTFTEQTGISLQGVRSCSLAWGDYDNDGDLDILLTGYTGSMETSKIYKNNGNNTFSEQTSISLPGVFMSSVAWGDYDNDGYLDFILTGLDKSKIYHNNGNGSFSEQTSISLQGVSRSSVAWGDYNNDGYLDIILTGSGYSKIYRNNGNGNFIEQTGIILDGVSEGSVAWGDYDNDGDLDILLTGLSKNGQISKIYKNNGNNTFTEQTGISLTGVNRSSVAWGDYDNDGDLDIILTGYKIDYSWTSKIYKNNGDNSFTEQTTISLVAVQSGSVAWGDYDNDGDLDLLLTGWHGGSPDRASIIYKNNGNGTFTQDTTIPLTGVENSFVAWGDYDNDGDLDILLAGSNNSNNSTCTKIFRNDCAVTNTAPASPSGLTSTMNGTDIILKWNSIKTDATPSKGMNYNVKVGTISGGINIVSPQVSTLGNRQTVSMGNAQTDTTFILRNLKKGTYYWSVQALDNCFTGSAFSSEQSFTYNVDFQAANLSVKDKYGSTTKVAWSRGNGDKCLVFAKENGSGNALPINSTTYTANAAFGSGSQIGTTGWYCVYNGNLDSVIVSNLKANADYLFQVLEYSGTAGSEIYNVITSTENPKTFHTNTFSLQTGISLIGVYDSSVAWGDYDNDGDLDILITGYSGATRITKIYKNNGNNTFTEQTSISLPVVMDSSVAWGDYNNDGYLDILLTGSANSSRISKVYRNNGNNTFTEQTSIILTGISQGSVAWGDYDNDGNLDILLTGYSISEGPVSKIYRNNGNNTFTEQTGISLAKTSGKVAWGDYDNDGYLDILITGYLDSNPVSKIYRNNRNNTFSEQTNILLPGFSQGSSAWGDYNNDGFLDILFTGYSYPAGVISKIYKNNGNNTFSEQTGISLDGMDFSTTAWGDYDNDGDLDILVTGESAQVPISKIYRNNGDNTFTEQTDLTLTGVIYGSATWGDYDNDGDLDILLTGKANSSVVSQIYRNDISTPNVVPGVPAGLVSSISSSVVLRWKPVKNDATPAKGMMYNIRVGKTSGASDVVSPMSSSSGFLRLQTMGNAQTDTTFVLCNLKKGTYYWSVQALDNTFAGGAFAPEQTFTYNADYPATAISYKTKTATSVTCSWTRGNGDKCVVFASEKGTGTAIPVNNTTYTGNKAFASGTQIGTTGWYCVYNGVQDTATITNLKANTEYRFHIIEYTGIAGAETYYTTVGSDNPAQYFPPFTEQAQISITGISGKIEAWGDYNNDGYLDLFIAGNDGSSSIAKLYKNNGDNTFTEVTTALFSISTAYDATWCDYDNDGDMDVLIAGLSNSKLYTNNGDGTFTLKTQLPSVYMGKSAWADLNNDGFKDLILTGSSSTSILKNNHDGTFTAQTTTLPAVSNYSSVATGDYDNDGDQDVLLAGYSNDASAEITKVYRNDGNFTFTEQTGIALTGVANCAVAWADMDNDGDLDIVLSGGAADVYTKIYDNNGNNTFTELTSTPLKGLYRSSMAIADYDNDGYRDVLVTGSVNGSDYFNLVYHNNGNKTYSQVNTLAFPGVQWGSPAWGDYDNDGDLDLFLCGNAASGKIAKVFKNHNTTANVKPNALNNSMYYSLNGYDITFFWNKTTDDKTSENGLSYNIYLYETSKSGFVKSAEALTLSNVLNGRKLAVKAGDIQYSSTGYVLKGLAAGNYKWSIQAVDAGLLGSDFVAEGSFIILDLSGVGIDVVNLRITGTKSSMQYSTNSTDGVNGTWNNCNDNYSYCNFNTGGLDVWVRERNNSSNKQKVASVATQAAAPAYTINFAASTTTENIPVIVEYSNNSIMTSGVSAGNGSPLSLTPGTNLYFRIKATSTSVASAIQTLLVPVAPAAPAFTIDYNNETTVQAISSAYEFSNNLNMNNPNPGLGNPVILIPGQDIYFMGKATTTSFKSGIQTLIVPARPAAPYNFVINDLANTFDWTYASGYSLVGAYQYSTNNGSTWTTCAAKPTNVGNVDIATGALKLRVMASSTRFASDALASNASFSINTGVATFEEVGIKMYPNPVSDILIIEGLKELSKISICDIHGKLIKTYELQNNSERIDVNYLPYGMYILKIESSSATAESKFIKQ